MLYASYSRTDQDTVLSIIKSLKVNGCQFFDDNQIVGGDFAEALTHRIEDSDAMLLFYSEASDNSTWVKRELSFAVSQGKPILIIELSKIRRDSWFYDYSTKFRCVPYHPADHNESISHLLLHIERELLLASECRDNSSSSSSISDKASKPRSQSFDKPTRIHTMLRWCVVISCLLFLLLFVFYRSLMAPMVRVKKRNPGNDYSFEFIEQKKDSLRTTEILLKRKIENLLSELQKQVYRKGAVPGQGQNELVDSLDREIKEVLGVEQIPYTLDLGSSSSEGEEDYYFGGTSSWSNEYEETVRQILEEHISEINVKIDSLNSLERSPERPTSVLASPYLFPITFLILGGLIIGVVVLLLHNRKGIVKLTSNIPCVVSIDGKLCKQLPVGDVYETRLRKGEYLFDFKDLCNASRHMAFSRRITSNDQNLVYAEFKDDRELNEEKSIKCFIAGSKALQRERDALRSVISIMYNKWSGHSFRIVSYTFDDFEKSAVQGGHQAEYNRFIAEEADWVIIVIDGAIGGVTVEEYREAMHSFKVSGKPKILALNHSGGNINDKEISAIRAEINHERQYWTDYKSIDELKMVFESTLNWDLIEMYTASHSMT